MNFAIYSRKSLYTAKGDSIENQVEMCRNYILSNFSEAQEENLMIFEDVGFSGKDVNRPQFQLMMREIDRGNIDCIVCYRLDRISRSVIDFSSLAEKLAVKRVKFVSIKEQFDTSSPTGRAMMYVSAAFAQMEREIIAERIRDNLLLLARTGRWLGGVTPLGFCGVRSKEVLIDGKVKKASFLEINDQMPTVITIFEKYLELGNCAAVAEYVNAQNRATANNNLFNCLYNSY